MLRSSSDVYDMVDGRNTVYDGIIQAIISHDKSFTRNMAEDECNQNGGHLLSVDTAEELSAILRVSETQPECGDLGQIAIFPQVFIGLVSKVGEIISSIVWTDIPSKND